MFVDLSITPQLGSGGSYAVHFFSLKSFLQWSVYVDMYYSLRASAYTKVWQTDIRKDEELGEQHQELYISAFSKV